MINILPADTFVVINKTILSNNDRVILTMLYQPIIGSISTSLYFTFWSYLDKSEVSSKKWNHHHIMTNTRFSLDQIKEAREKLEAIGLLKTYIKKSSINEYIYELYSPLNAYDFLNNPLLSTAFSNLVGENELKKTIDYFKIPKMETTDYEDITRTFSDVFESSNIDAYDTVIDDIKRQKSLEIKLTPKIELNSILDLISDEILNKKSITKELKDYIYKVSFIYNFDNDLMIEVLKNSINEAHSFDRDKIKETAHNIYKYENSGGKPTIIYSNQPLHLRRKGDDTSKRAKLIYTFETNTPYEFLLSKNRGVKPSSTDLKIIEYLLLELELNPGVVNVLVDYILKINNNKLTKSFVETIAGQWKRSNIITVEEAMNIAEKEYKQKRTRTIKEKEKPTWIGQKIDDEQATIEEQLEFANKLNSMKVRK